MKDLPQGPKGPRVQGPSVQRVQGSSSAMAASGRADATPEPPPWRTAATPASTQRAGAQMIHTISASSHPQNGWGVCLA